MPSSVTVTERDRYTVAGLIRHLARVAAGPRDARARRLSGAPGPRSSTSPAAWRRRPRATGSASVTGSPFSTATASPTSTSSSGARCIGAVNVAVNWRSSPAEMAAIIDDSGAPRPGDPRGLPSGAGRHAERSAHGPAHRGDRRRRTCGLCRSSRRDLRGVDRRVPGRGSGPRRDARRGEHAALHLRHDRTAQGRHADQRQPVDRDRRRGRDLQHPERHGEPGRHAAVPHRRIRLGAVRHVSRRAIDHPARRRPGRAAAS